MSDNVKIDLTILLIMSINIFIWVISIVYMNRNNIIIFQLEFNLVLLIETLVLFVIDLKILFKMNRKGMFK